MILPPDPARAHEGWARHDNPSLTAARPAGQHPRTRLLAGLFAPLLALAGCANPALRQAQELAQAQHHERAYAIVSEALEADAGNVALRAAQHLHRERAASQLVLQIEALRTSGRHAEANALLSRLQAVYPQHPRLQSLRAELDREQRHAALVEQARTFIANGQHAQAEARLREVAAESPAHPALRALRARLSALQARESDTPDLSPAFQKPVSLEFRDASLRQVFEALARSSDVNFVFDREVKGDQRITVFLRNVTLDEALRVILGSNQLERKLLNAESVLIYPATQAKQREHQELVTRTFYLANADPNKTQNLLKTIAKVRDVHVDERIGTVVIRDTPEVLRLAEKLIASIDLPEPEVMLDVEVMEIASDQLDALGLQWPDQIFFGVPGLSGQVELGRRSEFRGSIANPAVIAVLRGTAGQANLLANPKIRVRNREKARVHIGQKLPVFTTTAIPNAGVSASVTYLDVGLKLDVEPSVGLEGDVTIRVGLEVSNVLRPVSGPSGAVAYEVGTRVTNTSLRLADGETQVISGLVNDEDRRSASGVPGLSSMPLVGALFGVNTTTRNKTEVVLLITPRVLRNLSVPDIGVTRIPAGNDAYPGAPSSQLRPRATVALPAPAVPPSGGAPAPR